MFSLLLFFSFFFLRKIKNSSTDFRVLHNNVGRATFLRGFRGRKKNDIKNKTPKARRKHGFLLGHDLRVNGMYLLVWRRRDGIAKQHLRARALSLIPVISILNPSRALLTWTISTPCTTTVASAKPGHFPTRLDRSKKKKAKKNSSLSPPVCAVHAVNPALRDVSPERSKYVFFFGPNRFPSSNLFSVLIDKWFERPRVFLYFMRRAIA